MPYSQNKRPIIKIPRSPLEVAVEIGSLIGLLAVFGILVMIWSDIPNRIPQHFGFTGQPDAWGDKETLFFLPVVSGLLYLLLSIVSKYPHVFNYPVEITEKNAGEQYLLARLLLGWLKLVIVWQLAFIQYKTVMVALGKVEGLGLSILVFVAITFIIIFIYIYRSFKIG